MGNGIITVPNDIDSQNLFINDVNYDENLLRVVISEKSSHKIFEEGFFDLINSIAGSNIGLWESDEISNKSAMIDVLEYFSVKDNKELFSEKDIIDEILNLFHEAVNRGTSIFFDL